MASSSSSTSTLVSSSQSQSQSHSSLRNHQENWNHPHPQPLPQHNHLDGSRRDSGLKDRSEIIFTTRDELEIGQSSQGKDGSQSQNEATQSSSSSSFASPSPSTSTSTHQPPVSISSLFTQAPKHIHRSFPPRSLTRTTTRSSRSKKPSSDLGSNPTQSHSTPISNSNPQPSTSASTSSTSSNTSPTGSYQLPNALHIDIAFSIRPPPPKSKMAAPILLSSKSNPPTCYFYEVDQTLNKLHAEGGRNVSSLPEDWRQDSNSRDTKLASRDDHSHSQNHSQNQNQSQRQRSQDRQEGTVNQHRHDHQVALAKEEEEEIDHRGKRAGISIGTQFDLHATNLEESRSQIHQRSRLDLNGSNDSHHSENKVEASSIGAPDSQAEEEQESNAFQRIHSSIQIDPTSPIKPSLPPIQPSNPILTSQISSSSTPTQTSINEDSTLNSTTSTTNTATHTNTSSSDSSFSENTNDGNKEKEVLQDGFQTVGAEDATRPEEINQDEKDLLTPTLNANTSGLARGSNPDEAKRSRSESEREREDETRKNHQEREGESGKESDSKEAETQPTMPSVENQNQNQTSKSGNLSKPIQAWGTKKSWSTLATPSTPTSTTSSSPSSSASTNPTLNTSSTSPSPSTSRIPKSNSQIANEKQKKSNPSTNSSLTSSPTISSQPPTTTTTTTTSSATTSTNQISSSNSSSNCNPNSNTTYASHLKPRIQPLSTILKDSHLNFDSPVTLPRGLINKGNLCFANSILQVLIYCPPFYNLFRLVGENLSVDFNNQTPLMEAMISFLREFQIVDSSSTSVGAHSSTNLNGKAGGGSGGGGGEEKKRSNPIELNGAGARNHQINNHNHNHNPNLVNFFNDEIVSEPFVPEFVYEAMRLNKRFDTMRRGHQEDAEEFLGFFLDTLHEEFLSAMKKSSEKLSSSSNPTKLKGAISNEDSVDRREGSSEMLEIDEKKQVGVESSTTTTSGSRPMQVKAEEQDDDEWLEVGQKGKTNFTRTTSTTSSPITNIFGGKFRSMLQIPGSKGSITLEPYQALQLDIAPNSVNTIEDALKQLVLPEIVHGVRPNANSSILVDATKQVRIETIPPILVVHLKRFGYDNVGGTVKNSKWIKYGSHLKIGEDLRSTNTTSRAKDQHGRYKLFGVVYHHGRHATGGHYTVDVLRQDGSSWIHIDDTTFHSIPAENVYTDSEKSSWGSKNHDGLAYLLFYQREDLSFPKDQINKLSKTNGINPNPFTSPTLNSGSNGWSSIGHHPDSKRSTNASSSITTAANQKINSSASPSIKNGSVTPFSQVQVEKLNSSPSLIPQNNTKSKKSSHSIKDNQSQNQNQNQHQNQNQNQNHNQRKSTSSNQNDKPNHLNSTTTTTTSSSNQAPLQTTPTTPVRKTVPGAPPPSNSTGKKSRKR